MFERTRDYPTAMTDPAAPADQAMSDAIGWFAQQVQALGGQPLLYLPQRRSAENDPQLSRLARAVKAETWTTLRSAGWQGGPVFAAWPDDKHLASVADHRGTTALVVLSWNAKDVAGWAAAARPRMLSVGASAPPAAVLGDPVVEQGLISLTRMVNHSNNLAGALDRRDAVSVLLTLHDAGHRLEPEPIYAWALAHGWPASGALRLREFVEKIVGGVRPRVQGSSPFRPDILQQWREAAQTGGSA